jgi:hypothetical protein
MTAKAQKLIAAPRTNAKFPYLIKISHQDYGEIYYANSSDNLVYKGEIYNAASFSIQPPDQDGAKIGSATLSISAVDQFWVQRIRETQKPARLQFVAVIVYEEGIILGIESLEENSFTLRAASWNEASISWDLSFDERQVIILTSAKCTPQISIGCA